jgi:hypothetical protein
MAFLAQQCRYTPHSRWVHAFIQGCGGELAVQYKHAVAGRRAVAASFQVAGPNRQVGNLPPQPRLMVPSVTCHYPSAPANWYAIAISYPSAGRFVHAFLYKKQPYRLIANPCPAQACDVATDCCANGIPQTLYLTLSGGTALNGSYPLVHDSGTGQWAGYLGTPGPNTQVFFECAGSALTFRLFGYCNGSLTFSTDNLLTMASCSCSPFSIVFPSQTFQYGDCTLSDTCDIVVTS